MPQLLFPTPHLMDRRFRWVEMQIYELVKYLNPADIDQQLKYLPKGLYKTYARILSRSDHPKYLKMVLQFL